MITLKNTTKRMRTYNLDRHHGKVRKFPQIRNLANGGSIGEIVKRKLPDSITFLAREIKSKHDGKPLPASIKECPDIKAALQRGELVEIKAPARPTPPKSPTPPQGNPSQVGSSGSNEGDGSGEEAKEGDSSGANEGGNDPDPDTVASTPSVGDDSGSSESGSRRSKKKASRRGR